MECTPPCDGMEDFNCVIPYRYEEMEGWTPLYLNLYSNKKLHLKEGNNRRNCSFQRIKDEMYVLSRKQQNMMNEIKNVKQEGAMNQTVILKAKHNEMKAKNELIQREKGNGFLRNVGASGSTDLMAGKVMFLRSNQGGRLDGNESVADSFRSDLVDFKSWSGKIIEAFTPSYVCQKNPPVGKRTRYPSKEVAVASMQSAALEEVTVTNSSDIIISGDGTWKARGYSSRVGVCAVKETKQESVLMRK
ncbi:hypothetical protein TNCV_3655071 [Trichonephila clavipes]|nr:hypothetical protein TNCV_3655071 [Trichonephila clavipes]